LNTRVYPFGIQIVYNIIVSVLKFRKEADWCCCVRGQTRGIRPVQRILYMYIVHAFRTSARRIVKRPDIIYIVSRNKNRRGAQRIILLYWWYTLKRYPESSEKFLAFLRALSSFVYYYLLFIFTFTVSLSDACIEVYYTAI
jgi:hypothetical protein